MTTYVPTCGTIDEDLLASSQDNLAGSVGNRKSILLPPYSKPKKLRLNIRSKKETFTKSNTSKFCIFLDNIVKNAKKAFKLAELVMERVLANETSPSSTSSRSIFSANT